MPFRIKQRIHTIYIFDSDSVMTWNSAITSVTNTLKKTHLSTTVFNEFTSKYYNYNNDSFAMFFQKYKTNFVNNIYHPDLIEEFKAIMENSDYEYKIHKGVYKTIYRENWIYLWMKTIRKTDPWGNYLVPLSRYFV